MNTATEYSQTGALSRLLEQAPSSKEVKCVIWDLDETLWHGTLAEGDQTELKPGIREILATLDARGILHSIASKNTFEDAMARLKALGIDHYFLYPQIGWNAKSVALANIQQSLNIGMDTLVFLDDQAFERDEVNAAHPQITCIPAELYQEITSHPRFNPKVITEDSSRRRQMYLEDLQRKQDEDAFSGTPDAFLATLGMVFRISRARPSDLLRAEELTVRTNQLNSTGVTYDQAELEAYMNSENHQLLICELTDKYGSYGKIGLTLIERQPNYDLIKLMLMSCRIVSRGVGSVLLTHLMMQAKAAGKTLRADFRRTDRNRQMLVTYQFANFKEIEKAADGRSLLENDLSFVQNFPTYIDVIVDTTNS